MPESPVTKLIMFPRASIMIDLPATQTEIRSALQQSRVSRLARFWWQRGSPERSGSREWSSARDLAAEGDRDSTGPLRRFDSNSTAPPGVSRDHPTRRTWNRISTCQIKLSFFSCRVPRRPPRRPSWRKISGMIDLRSLIQGGLSEETKLLSYVEIRNSNFASDLLVDYYW